MTAICYPDCAATSTNGRFVLEAKSPHNGEVSHRDGRPASEAEFAVKYHEHQSHFRYRLLKNSTDPGSPVTVWERWQEEDEDSPRELLVSDDGWAILRTHGFRPEVIAISPTGQLVLRVEIADSVTAASAQSKPRSAIWFAKHLHHTTVGHLWTWNSWPYFFHDRDAEYFVWRTAWGQRLVLDLQSAAILPERDAADPLSLAMSEREAQGAVDLLLDFSSKLPQLREWFGRQADQGDEDDDCVADPNPVGSRIWLLTPALHLVGVHRVTSALPLLREFEDLDHRSMTTSSSAMSNRWSLEGQAFRPILHHSLRILGHEPRGFATYHFCDDDDRRLAIPEHVPERHALSIEITRNMSAVSVLQKLGAPDHIRRRSFRDGAIFRGLEDWEYDFRIHGQWTTFRIVWEEGPRKGHISQMESGPADWLETDARVAEILGY